MNAKYHVYKQQNLLTGQKQWATVCCKCWGITWARDWESAMLIASYECEPCELWETAQAALDHLGVYRV